MNNGIAQCVFIIYLISSSLIGADYTCPTKGELGGAQIPRVSSLISSQTGYKARVELVSGTGYLLEVEETFNSQNSFGWFKLNDGAGHQQSSYWYYLETKESFYIDSELSCTAIELTDETKSSIINEWLAFNSLSDEVSIFNNPQNLGPILILLYIASKSNDARYIGEIDLEGRRVSCWFYCVRNEGPYFEIYFDASTNYPIRLMASYPDNPTLATTLNIVNFEPLTNQRNDLITYPYGYGCERKVASSVLIPIFAQADTFNLDMEAALFFTQPDRSAITTARIARYQGIYSYDLKENGITKRIVHDPKLLIDYQVDPLTGTCFENQAINGPGYGFTYLRWPYSNGENYNLLDEAILNLNSAKYMGQMMSETGLLDIFEKIEPRFFSLDDKLFYSALITYFVPANYDKRQKTRTQAPSKIVIKPIGDLSQIASTTLVNRIEIKVIDYHESSIDFENRFDISGCFTEQGDYTWFQIVFSGKNDDLLSWMNQDESLRNNVKTILSFIPEARIPDIRFTFIGSVVYISCKLLERPSYQYDFYKTSGFTISNPTKVIQLDHEQDCAAICADDESCTNFAYCNNLECRLFTSRSSVYPLIDESNDCDGFGRNSYFVEPTTVVEANFLISSKNLIHEIRTKLTNGELNLKEPVLSAIDLFIVSGPDEIGDPDTTGGANDDSTSVGDHYQVLLSNRRLIQGNVALGLNYELCLAECDNDDGCLLVSFCPARNGECILGYSTKDVNQNSTVLSEGCNVFSRSYLTFFRKFPGRSLVLSAQQVLKNTDIEECARICASQTQPCEAFDYCSKSENQKDSTTVSACFLHNYHVAKESDSDFDGAIWNFTDSKCDHYAKILSKDFKQLVGLKFDNSVQGSILSETKDVSLEICAGSCTTLGECKSFDFCEQKTQSGMITFKCRISSLKFDLKSSQSNENSLERCSIYISNHVDPSETTKSYGHVWLIIFLCLFMFLSAFLVGIFGARHYYKR